MQFLRWKDQKVHYSALFGDGKNRKMRKICYRRDAEGAEIRREKMRNDGETRAGGAGFLFLGQL